jgi:hypothetical protein
MKQPSIKKLQKQVDEFNNLYRVGSFVHVHKDSGEIVYTTVKTEAQILGGHSAVAWFDGISGCYRVDRVSPPF